MRVQPLPRSRTGEQRRTVSHVAQADLATKQHGIVSAGQLRRLGYAKRAVDRAVAVGRLHRIYRGVYAVGHTDLSLHGRCLAAVLGSGAGAFLSHYSAAWLWELGIRSPVPLHVTSAIPRRPRGDIARHRARNLTVDDTTEREGIPVASVARVLLDMAARQPYERTRRMLKRAEERGLFDLAQVESVIDRNGGHRGAKPLRLAVAVYRPSSFQRSAFEERFLTALIQAAVPRPHVNYVELGFELDLYWPEHRFAVELDVFETHGTRDSFESDRLRQEELLLNGVEMVRITSPRFEREPREVVARIATLLRERAPERPRGRGSIPM